MRANALLLLLPLAACGSADKQALAQAGEARSLLAETALIAELTPRTPETYAARLREEASQQLATLATETKAGTAPETRAIAALATVPAASDAPQLRQRSAQSRAIENRIEARLEGR